MPVIVANGETIECTIEGELDIYLHSDETKRAPFTLHKVLERAAEYSNCTGRGKKTRKISHSNSHRNNKKKIEYSAGTSGIGPNIASPTTNSPVHHANTNSPLVLSANTLATNAISGSEESIKIYIDSASGRNCCNNENWLHNKRSIAPVPVIVANGETIECTIEGELDIYLHSDETKRAPFTLHKVLYHPRFIDNLLSVGAICQQRGNRVVFENDLAELYLHNNYDAPAITVRAQSNIYAIEQKLSNPNSNPSTVINTRIMSARTATPASKSNQYSDALARVMYAHNSHGHASRTQLKLMQRYGRLRGTTRLRARDLDIVREIQCLNCTVAKMTRAPFAKERRDDEVSAPLECVSTDLAGPLPSPRFNARWVSLIIDKFSKFMHVRSTPTKGEAPQHVRQIITQLERQTKCEMKRFRCDGSKENETLREFCAELGAIFDRTPPHTPQLNGQAERAFRTLGETIRAMITATGCKGAVEFWPFAYDAAAYVLNLTRIRRVVNKVHGKWRVRHITAWEAMFGKKASVEHLHPWGCDVVYKENKYISTLTNPGREGILLGYSWYSAGQYRVYDVETQRVIDTRDIVVPVVTSYRNMCRVTTPDSNEAEQMFAQPSFLWNQGRVDEDTSSANAIPESVSAALDPNSYVECNSINHENIEQLSHAPVQSAQLPENAPVHELDSMAELVLDMGDLDYSQHDYSQHENAIQAHDDGGASMSSFAEPVPQQRVSRPPRDRSRVSSQAAAITRQNREIAPTWKPENWSNPIDNHSWIQRNHIATWVKQYPDREREIRSTLLPHRTATNIPWAAISKDARLMSQLHEIVTRPVSVANHNIINSSSSDVIQSTEEQPISSDRQREIPESRIVEQPENWRNSKTNYHWLMSISALVNNNAAVVNAVKEKIMNRASARNIDWHGISLSETKMATMTSILTEFSLLESAPPHNDSDRESEEKSVIVADDPAPEPLSVAVHADQHASNRVLITRDMGDKYYRAFIARTATVQFTPTAHLADPTSRAEAMKRDDWPLFAAAEKLELDAFRDHDVFELVDNASIDPSVPIINLKSLYTIKRDEQMNPLKYKCRIVAQGNRQIEGVNYFDTSSPVMKLESMRALIQIANIFKLKIHQADVNNAYLNATLQETVLCRMPKGFEPPGFENRIYRLKRALYGLKQAGLEWYKEFTGTITQLGFHPLESDPCIFVRETKSKAQILLGVFVDDVISVFHPRDEGEWIAIKHTMNSKYGIKDLGECSKILGMTVNRSVEDRVCHIGQEGYIQKVLDEFLPTEQVRTVSTPGTLLKLLMEPADGPEVPLDEKGKHRYWELIGNLMYAANTTRIDIATIVNHLGLSIQDRVCITFKQPSEYLNT